MTAFSKPCCLVAEDQALIALALEAALEEVGIGIAPLLRRGSHVGRASHA
jgi:hypothetical protein